MYNFHEGLYTDVRKEAIFETSIQYKENILEEQKLRHHKGAFIRVFDGERWYYSATTKLDSIQDEINTLSKMAKPNNKINEHPIVKAFEVHNRKELHYENNSVENIPIEEKRQITESYFELFADNKIARRVVSYVDSRSIKNFYSSKGSNITFDKQTLGIRAGLDMVFEEKKYSCSLSKAFMDFAELAEAKEYMREEVEKSIDFLMNSENVDPGVYPVVLSPLATGVFTHESFGHKSEADFMVGDEAAIKEWAIGKKVANDLVTIVDDGTESGVGLTTFDDEGTLGKKTNIITEGILTGRLHSIMTASLMDEEPTGNARAINFIYEPIVRMTTTYIVKGTKLKEELISGIEKGIYIDTIKHGSGMSTFTMAPSRAYMIENGKITKPIKVSVVSGNVFETLELIDGVSREFELLSFVGGGCGKMEQFPLQVGFGGPFVSVKKLNVQ